jgi:hypothetical protein
MGAALIGTHTFKQNLTGGAFEALAAGAGDALAVPNFTQNSKAYLLEAWAANSAHVYDVDLRSPSFHDNTRGIRLAGNIKPAAGDPQILTPRLIRQPLYASDVMTAEVNATAADNQAFDFLAYFEDLPGADQRLASWPELDQRAVDMVGIFVGPTAGAAGDWGAARAINADDDRLIANTDYAVLGAVSQLRCTAMAIVGPETSGRKITLPLLPDSNETAGFFQDISAKYALPLIPIINSNNKGNITIQVADPNGATAPHITLLLMELAP